MKFPISKVGDYASHQLSIWRGKCPHGCKYCYVDKLFGRYTWASGPLRRSSNSLKLCKFADPDDVKCLILSFSGDPLPRAKSRTENQKRLKILMRHLHLLELREIKTKVLTKNTFIRYLTKHVEPYDHIQVGMTISTDSYNFKEVEYWEKGLPSIQRRLAALQHLSDIGFQTWCSMEPVLPGTDIRKAIAEITDTGISELWIGKGSYDKRLEQAFSWGLVARQITELNMPQIHLKKELRRFLKTKEYQTVLQSNLGVKT